MKTVRTILTALAVLFGLAACKGNTEVKIDDKINIVDGSEVMSFEKSGGKSSVKFAASNPWKLELNSAWVEASRLSGPAGTFTVSFTIAQNETYEDREAQAQLVCGTVSKTFTFKQPAKARLYKVVAHRCGFLENGAAENSLTALQRTIDTHCYAAEVDVVWTADNDVVVCHPVDGKVNGLLPVQHTLAEIRAAGTLTDGSQMPSLGDFLKILADKEKNPLGTKVWLDIKGNSVDEYQKVMDRSAEIAKEYGACNLVEYLVPSGYADYKGIRTSLASNYGIEAAWNSKVDAPENYGANGWAQMPFGTLRASEYWPVTKYFDAGVRVSVYQTPSNKNSYSGFIVDMFPYYDRVKAIFVNHPQYIIDELVKQGYAEK